jgi:hypothetical protein
MTHPSVSYAICMVYVYTWLDVISPLLSHSVTSISALVHTIPSPSPLLSVIASSKSSLDTCCLTPDSLSCHWTRLKVIVIKLPPIP